MGGWHVETYQAGTLRMVSQTRDCSRDTAFRYARRIRTRDLIRVVERKSGEWVYHYRSGRKAGVWKCPDQ